VNTRFRELAQQATRKYDRLGNEIPFAQPDLELFAELIVRECAKIAEEQAETAEYSFTATRAKWFRLGAIKSSTMIKRTFGIEK